MKKIYYAAGFMIFLIFCCGCNKRTSSQEKRLPDYTWLMEQENGNQIANETESYLPSIDVSYLISNDDSDEDSQNFNSKLYNNLVECLQKMKDSYADKDEHVGNASTIHFTLMDKPDWEPDIVSYSDENEIYLLAFCSALSEPSTKSYSFYLIITGSRKYISEYLKNFKALMESVGLNENVDYFVVGSLNEANMPRLTTDQVIVSPSISYNEAKQQIDSGIYGLSRNLLAIENAGTLFDGSVSSQQILAYQYKLIEGLGKNNDEWWLELYMPLFHSNDNNISYQHNITLYRNQELGNGETEWVEYTGPAVQYKVDKKMEYPRQHREYPSAYCIRLSENGEEETNFNYLLMLIRIIRTECTEYQPPDWIQDKEFIFFYDKLFEPFLDKKQSAISTIYAEVPVLITNLNKEGK